MYKYNTMTIMFAGPAGVGKTTVLKMVQKYLKRKGFNIQQVSYEKCKSENLLEIVDSIKTINKISP